MFREEVYDLCFPVTWLYVIDWICNIYVIFTSNNFWWARIIFCRAFVDVCPLLARERI